MNGWIKLHRQFLEWEWYTDQNVKSVFLHCLLMANVENKEWRGEQICRGSFISSIGKMAIDTGLSVKAVRLAIDKLKRTSEIVTTGTNKWTTITVCKYDTYQINIFEEGQTNGTPKDKPRANQGQTKGEQGATTKEYKKERRKEGEEVKNIIKPNWAFVFKNYDPEIIYPFELPEFGKAWDLWIEYRKERKISSYTKISVQAALKDLSEISKNNIQTAIEIINRSISKNWQGLFEIKNNDKNRTHAQTIDSIAAIVDSHYK